MTRASCAMSTRPPIWPRDRTGRAYNEAPPYSPAGKSSRHRARTAHVGPTYAVIGPRGGTSGAMPRAYSQRIAERRGFRCVCRSQTFDFGSVRSTLRRQTAARGPQRPECGPKTSDPSALRGPCFAVKHPKLPGGGGRSTVGGPPSLLRGRKFRAQTVERGCLRLECRPQRFELDPWRSMLQPKTSEFGIFGQTSASGMRPPNWHLAGAGS